MSNMEATNHFSGAGIQELSFEEIDFVDGGIAWVPIIIGGALLVTAAVAIYSGWKAEHNNDTGNN